MKDEALVVAYKYNDILYAICTDEVVNSRKKKLLIIHNSNRNPKDYPAQAFFDEVKYLNYSESNLGMLKNLISIYGLRSFLKADYITISNHILLINKLIVKLSKAKKIILVEDGLMNYYPASDICFNSHRNIKIIIEKLLGLCEIQKIKCSQATYLLKPEVACTYIGTKKQLEVKGDALSCLNLDAMSFLNGKKILVGQPLYDMNVCSIDEYNSIVNKVIKENSIDYYIPHYFASDLEKINCKKINLDNYHVTLEYVACKYNFDVYSFSSTILYSSKLLNNGIHSYMLKIPSYTVNQKIILETVDEIIEL